MNLKTPKASDNKKKKRGWPVIKGNTVFFESGDIPEERWIKNKIVRDLEVELVFEWDKDFDYKYLLQLIYGIGNGLNEK